MNEKRRRESIEHSAEVLRKPYHNNHVAMAGPQVGDGDNNRFTNLGLEIMLLPKIELSDTEAVATRIKTYFEIYAKYDTKPTVTGLANALHIDRRRLWEIATGNVRSEKGIYGVISPESRDLIKRSYELLAEMWENFMLNGKVNPVSGIFLGKNHFGYQDKTEYVVTPNTKGDSDFSADDIARRYLPEGADSQDPIDSDS